MPAVVHQYDRHLSLFLFTNKIYREQNFQFDEHFKDTRSVIEQAVYLLQINKTTEATQIFLKKFLSPADFSQCGGALMRLWSTALEKPLSESLGILELSVQIAATSTKNFGSYFLAAICEFFECAKKVGHPVDPEFKKHIAGVLFEMAERDLKMNNPTECFLIINAIKELDMPPDKNFYLFVAESNRIFGRKDEALAAYKKVLELS